ncbi:MAG: energy transducer TonB, partial [Fibrobacter sp.]|nr:energy transducer TonB [Fibrobacter sp.]
MAKKNLDPFIASLMPESDKKMGAIAGVSLVIALAMCIWASMYEQVVAEVVFDNADSVDLTTSMQIEQKEEKKEEK